MYVQNDPENARVLHELKNLARSETWANNVRTAAYFVAGLGVLLVCGAVAAVIYDNGAAFGAAFASQRIANAGTSFGQAISEALANAKIQGRVELGPGGQVTIRQDEPLHVTGDPRPTEAQTTARPASNAAKIMTDVTVFKTVEMPPGKVVTGWKFDDSSQDRPSRQYCYYMKMLDDNAHAEINIGENGTFTPPKRVPGGLNVVEAFQHCVWDN